MTALFVITHGRRTLISYRRGFGILAEELINRRDHFSRTIDDILVFLQRNLYIPTVRVGDSCLYLFARTLDLPVCSQMFIRRVILME